jgi:response regulator of citrate/malate metabolism
MNINCIIVDDEPIARDILKTYIEQIPYLTLVASCEDAFEAMKMISEKDIGNS